MIVFLLLLFFVSFLLSLSVIIVYLISLAYGYGFLMILLVCLGSLLGVFLVPLIKSDSKVGRQTYEYVYAFMIAIGTSALITDAILHLIPHVSTIHSLHSLHIFINNQNLISNIVGRLLGTSYST